MKGLDWCSSVSLVKTHEGLLFSCVRIWGWFLPGKNTGFGHLLAARR